jgi:hypothetical protein
LYREPRSSIRAVPRFLLLLGLLVLASTVPRAVHVALPHHHAGLVHFRTLSRAPSRLSLSGVAAATPDTVSLFPPSPTTASDREAVLLWSPASVSRCYHSRAPPLLWI